MGFVDNRFRNDCLFYKSEGEKGMAVCGSVKILILRFLFYENSFICFVPTGSFNL